MAGLGGGEGGEAAGHEEKRGEGGEAGAGGGAAAWSRVGGEDLAEAGGPVSDFLSLSGDAWPVTEEAWRKYALSDEQLAQYDRDGFLAHLPLLAEEQVRRLRAELDVLAGTGGDRRWYEFHANESPDPSSVLFHALGAWRIAPSFHDILFHPAILVPASQLLGSRSVRFWHDQLFVKPPKEGGAVAYHQDYSYWTRTEPLAHLTFHIALDTQTKENGGLEFVPGSHRWPLLPITSLHFDDLESIRRVLTPEQAHALEHSRTLAGLAEGTMSVHHGLTVHGSLANRSDAPRRAAVVNLFADGTRVARGARQPLLEGVPVLPEGEPVSGPFFPLLLGRRP
jgi:hypothetical protein